VKYRVIAVKAYALSAIYVYGSRARLAGEAGQARDDKIKTRDDYEFIFLIISRYLAASSKSQFLAAVFIWLVKSLIRDFESLGVRVSVLMSESFFQPYFFSSWGVVLSLSSGGRIRSLSLTALVID